MKCQINKGGHITNYDELGKKGNVMVLPIHIMVIRHFVGHYKGMWEIKQILLNNIRFIHLKTILIGLITFGVQTHTLETVHCIFSHNQ